MSADGIDTPPPSDNPSLPATNASIEHPELTPQRDEGTPATDAADSLAGTKGPDPPTLAMSRDEDHALTESTFDDLARNDPHTEAEIETVLRGGIDPVGSGISAARR